MEDQFGGRTDDDLFYDDFEPVEAESGEAESVPIQPPRSEPAPEPVPTSQPNRPPAASKPTPAPASTTAYKPLPPAKGLAHSRYADRPSPKPSPAPSAKAAPASLLAASYPSSSPPPNAPTAPKEKLSRASPSSQNTAVSAEARLQSGANPRQKLTDSELSAKMEKMKLLSAEKTRKFEKAEMDEKQHAEAYARGMEELRKRRAEEVERRKRGEEDRRRLEDERAKNRERKLKAMNMKDSSWDEGKEAIAEEEAGRGFRGANGGLRGYKGRGLGGSRFSTDDGERPDVDRFLDDRHRGQGRGGDRSRGGSGRRGGRGTHGPASTSSPAKQAVPESEDFPELPPSDGLKKKTEAAEKTRASKLTMAQAIAATPLPLPVPTGGKWGDEMDDIDAMKRGQS